MLAELAELADALDSGSSAARLPGSSPGFRILRCFRLKIQLKTEGYQNLTEFLGL